jgi:hypothetical protein
VTEDRRPQQGPDEQRLDFRSDGSTAVALDGVWRPRTRDSTSELTGLIRALDAQQAPVCVLMLNPDGWQGRPRRIGPAGQSVRIEWMTMLERSVVIGSTARGSRIDLHLELPADDAPRP